MSKSDSNTVLVDNLKTARRAFEAYRQGSDELNTLSGQGVEIPMEKIERFKRVQLALAASLDRVFQSLDEVDQTGETYREVFPEYHHMALVMYQIICSLHQVRIVQTLNQKNPFVTMLREAEHMQNLCFEQAHEKAPSSRIILPK